MSRAGEKSSGTQDAVAALPEGERLKLLEMAANLAHVGHWRLDVAESNLYWSEEIYAIHGVSPADYAPELQSAINFYHPDDAQRVAGLVEAAIAKKEPFDFEFRIVRPDDEIRHVHSRGRVTTDSSGSVSTVFGVIQDITDRVLTEDALREVRLRLDLAVRGSSSGLWYVNLETEELYWSPRLMDMMGIDPKDFRPRLEEFRERLHPDDREVVYSDLEQHINNAVPFNVELRLRDNSGKYPWMQARGQADWDPSGKPLRMAGSVDDITLRKREEIFREQIYAIFTSPTGQVETKIPDILDLSLSFLNLDRAAVYKVVDDGYEIEWASESITASGLGANQMPAVSYLGSVLEGRGVITHNDLADVSNGSASIHFISMPLYVDGKPYGALWFASDIATKRVFTNNETTLVPVIERLISFELFQRNALEDTANRRAELDRILNGVPVRIWYKDGNNRILRLNNEAARSMNMSVEDAEGADTYDLFPEMAAKYHADDVRVIESGKAEMGIIEKYTPVDGTNGWISTDKIPFLDPETGEARLLVVSQDITALMSAQERLEQQAEELKQSNLDLDQFAYIASHDLRAPMRGVDQLAQWIEEDLGDKVNEDVRKNLALMRGRVARLDRMLTDILLFARAGKRDELQEPIAMDAVLEEVIGWIKPRSRIKVTAQPSSLRVKMSHTQLQQLLLNLINNAVKHHDLEDGRVEVSAQRQGASLVITVRDDGPGIPRKFQSRVFEMFRTLQSRDEREGSGIGLAVVARLVRAYDGRVVLTSPLADERGTQFQVILPGTLID